MRIVSWLEAGSFPQKDTLDSSFSPFNKRCYIRRDITEIPDTEDTNFPKSHSSDSEKEQEWAGWARHAGRPGRHVVME